MAVEATLGEEHGSFEVTGTFVRGMDGLESVVGNFTTSNGEIVLTEASQAEFVSMLEAQRVAAELGSAALEGVEVVAKERNEENMHEALEHIDAIKNSRLGNVFGDITDTARIRELLDPENGNMNIREGVTQTLQRAIDELGQKSLLPERVQANNPNNLKSVADLRFGYENEKYSSREYAALLALAMLDGTFDTARSKSSHYNDLPDDDPRNGQHRQAARLALKYLEEESRANDSQVEQSDEQDEEMLSEEERAIKAQVEQEILQIKDNFNTIMPRLIPAIEAYQSGLPQYFDTQQVSQEFMTVSQATMAMSGEFASVVQRMTSLNEKGMFSDESVAALALARNNLEECARSMNFLAQRVDELNGDQNALGQVAAFVGQQVPQVLESIHGTQYFLDAYS